LLAFELSWAGSSDTAGRGRVDGELVDHACTTYFVDL
jgi:hypothetical protein